MKNIKHLTIATLFSFLITGCNEKKISEKQSNETKTENLTVAPENLETASFHIDGMTCEMGCAKTIESKLAGLNGVTEATVDFKNNSAKVTFDNSIQNTDEIVKVVEAVAGGDTYKVSEVKTTKG